jgi:hypothetical protein
MISEWWIGKDLEGNGHGLILRYCPGIAWRDWRKPPKHLSGYAVSTPRFEVVASWIRSRWVNYSTTTFVVFLTIRYYGTERASLKSLRFIKEKNTVVSHVTLLLCTWNPKRVVSSRGEAGGGDFTDVTALIQFVWRRSVTFIMSMISNRYFALGG